MSSNFQGLIVRGLLSVLLSRGPETLTEEINLRWPNSVDISDHGWAVAWFSNVPWLINKSREIVKSKKKLVLVGHSFGGTAILMTAQALAKEGLEVDLLCPIDPAWQYPATLRAPDNCKRIVTFVEHMPNQLGQGELTEGAGWTKHEWSERETRYLMRDTHLQIVADPFVHKTIITEIAKL